MTAKTSRGNVLVIADDEKPAARLCRWVSAVGEEPMLVRGSDKLLFERGDDESIDLVITELDTDAPQARALLDRLLEGELFFGVPQLHLLGDDALREKLQEVNPDVAAVSLGGVSDEDDFQVRVRLAAEVGRLRREVARTSIHDELTGTYDRRYLQTRLEQELSRARRHGTELSLVLLDIDGLNKINQAYGLHVGDRAILLLARVIEPRLRVEDVYGRWGEKTFAVVLTNTPYRGAAVFANKIRSEVETLAVAAEKAPVRIRISGGVASYHLDRGLTGTADVVHAAEAALRQAKSRGGNRIFIDEAVISAEPPVIVLADSDPAFLDPAEDLLSLEDYRVVRVDSAQALLESVRLRRPDLLILDLALPGAVESETSLVEAVRAAYPESPVPVIGLTSHGSADPEASMGGARVETFLTKPFSVNVLRGLVREILEQRQRADVGGLSTND